MSHFPDRALYAGIPNALAAFLITYENCSRSSGRTSAMVAAFQEGDRVFVTSEREAYRIERLARERGVKVRCFSAPFRSAKFEQLMRGDQPPGRAVFDHGWIQNFYEQQLKAASVEFWQINERLNPSLEEIAPCPKQY